MDGLGRVHGYGRRRCASDLLNPNQGAALSNGQGAGYKLDSDDPPSSSSTITTLPPLITPLRYKLERDPIEVLEGDPDLVRRAQDMDAPFEPVCGCVGACRGGRESKRPGRLHGQAGPPGRQAGWPAGWPARLRTWSHAFECCRRTPCTTLSMRAG